MQLKPSPFLQKKLEKFGLIREINARLHGDLICYVVSFKCKLGVVQISRGSADKCPYRMDLPMYESGIERIMFSLSHFENPWDELCKKIWNTDFGPIEFMGPQIEAVRKPQLFEADARTSIPWSEVDKALGPFGL